MRGNQDEEKENKEDDRGRKGDRRILVEQSDCVSGILFGPSNNPENRLEIGSTTIRVISTTPVVRIGESEVNSNILSGGRGGSSRGGKNRDGKRKG